MITIEHARRLRSIIEKAAAYLPDEEAVSAPELFPAWAVGVYYAVDERVKYNNKLYRVVQAHTSQADWTPDATPALYTEVALPGTIPVWRRPTGAQDAYNRGDEVLYPDENGDVYMSLIDSNVWSPEEYPQGWELEEGDDET